MKWLYSKKLSIVIAGLAVSVIGVSVIAEAFYIDNMEEYFLYINHEQLHFIAQPQAGFVLKIHDDIDSTDSTGRFLKATRDFKISPIYCLGRKGLYVVYDDHSAEDVRNTKTLGFNSEVQYKAPLFSSNGETVAIIPEIVIRVKPGTENVQVQDICEAMGCSIIKRMDFTTQEYLIEVLGIDADTVFETVEQLNEISFVEWACPNTACRPKLCGQIIPDDEYFSEQWHLHNTGQICLYGLGGTPNADINAPEAWEVTTGDPNIVVAVLDTGVDTNHPDLVNNLVPGYDFWENDDLPYPALNHSLNAHGTACAGLIAAQGNNGIGVSGVTWNCKIMPIRHSSHENAENQHFITESEEATAIRWSANHGAHVLSCQWGFYSPKPIVHSAIVDITEIGGIGRDGKGCVVCFSTGNNGSSLHWPAQYPEVIAVGATDHHDVRWHYSNYGPELDVVAPSGGLTLEDIPGGFQCTTDISGFHGVNNSGMPDVYGPIVNLDMDYRYFGGTSAACPVTAGVVALILSVDPNLTNLQVQQILYRSAHDLGEPGWDQYYGWGCVDARIAVEMALNPHIYVDDDGPADFNNIQAGIDAANDGDTVLVAPGDYVITEPITFKGKAITVRSKAGPEATTIRMSDSPNDPDRASVVIFENNETETSVLDGFTISGGQGCLWNPAPGYSFHAGGGIFCSASSPTITGCIISENHSFSQNQARPVGGGVLLANSSAIMTSCLIHKNRTNYAGGGMYIGRGSPTVIDCTISQNTAYHDDGQAGGLYIGGSSCKAYLLRCTISGNFTPHAGGGIQVDREAQPTFVDCLIADNTSEHIGGILCSFSSETTLTNCIITRNIADLLCGGIASGHDGKAIVTNCTITNNEAGQHSGGVTSYDNSSITLKNCIVYGNTAPNGLEIGLDYSYYHTPTSMNVSYCNIKGGLSAAHIGQGTILTWEEGNIDTDPLFVDPENSDYHLKSESGRYDPINQILIQDDVTSLCIDAGDPNRTIGNEPEPNGGRINIGAYGGTNEASKSP